MEQSVAWIHYSKHREGKSAFQFENAFKTAAQRHLLHFWLNVISPLLTLVLWIYGLLAFFDAVPYLSHSKSLSSISPLSPLLPVKQVDYIFPAESMAKFLIDTAKKIGKDSSLPSHAFRLTSFKPLNHSNYSSILRQSNLPQGIHYHIILLEVFCLACVLLYTATQCSFLGNINRVQAVLLCLTILSLINLLTYLNYGFGSIDFIANFILREFERMSRIFFSPFGFGNEQLTFQSPIQLAISPLVRASVICLCCPVLRNFLWKIIKTFPQICYPLLIVMGSIFFFDWFGVIAFSGTSGHHQFKSFKRGAISLLLMISTVNIPEVIYPSCTYYQASALYFVSFYLIVGILLMSYLAAIICTAFKEQEDLSHIDEVEHWNKCRSNIFKSISENESTISRKKWIEFTDCYKTFDSINYPKNVFKGMWMSFCYTIFKSYQKKCDEYKNTSTSNSLSTAEVQRSYGQNDDYMTWPCFVTDLDNLINNAHRLYTENNLIEDPLLSSEKDCLYSRDVSNGKSNVKAFIFDAPFFEKAIDAWLFFLLVLTFVETHYWLAFLDAQRVNSDLKIRTPSDLESALSWFLSIPRIGISLLYLLLTFGKAAKQGFIHFQKNTEGTGHKHSFDLVVAPCFFITEILSVYTGSSVLMAFASSSSYNRAFALVRVFSGLRLLFRIKGSEESFNSLTSAIKQFLIVLGPMFMLYHFYATLGMQLYGGKRIQAPSYLQSPQSGIASTQAASYGVYRSVTYAKYVHFDDFSSALLTLFVLMVNGFDESLQNLFERVSPMWCALYFSSFYILSDMVILNLFISLILGDYEKKAEESLTHPENQISYPT